MENSVWGKRGVSLVEGIVTVALFSLIFGASVLVLLSGSNSWQVEDTRNQMQDELRKSLDAIREDVVEAGTSTMTSPTDGGTDVKAVFRVASGVSGGSVTWSANTIQLSLGGTGSNQLQRISGGVTKVIANNIKTLQFSRVSSLVTVSLTAEKKTPSGRTIDVTMQSDIRMRD